MALTMGVAMICARDEPFADLSIASIIDWVDKIVIVGDANQETLNRIFTHPYASKKIKYIFRKWDNDYGSARQKAVDELDTVWCIQLDMDEIIGDTPHLFNVFMQSDVDVYSMKYRHFIRTFSLEDATIHEHIGINRFFKNKGVKYNRPLHEYAESPEWHKEGIIRDIIIWHLGYLKGVNAIQDKYIMNKGRSPIHDTEFIKMWHDAHLLGQYPVSPVAPEELPRLIRQRFEL